MTTPQKTGSFSVGGRVAPFAWLSVALALGACVSPEVEGLYAAEPAATMVKLDFLAKPLPEIPLPNDIATRYDPTSATGRRINASLIAPTGLEKGVRAHIDQLDGWGVNQAITIPFTGPIDINSILAAHRDPHYDLADDVVYLIDITPGSPEYGQARHLDVGNGNYPAVLEDMNGYWANDPRGWTNNLFFEEADEDLNRNGKLDPGEDLNGNGTLDAGEDLNHNSILDPPEDTDADGVLDRPNYLPGMSPSRDDLAGRADALMTFYERETNTLILRPMLPLRERTTYAVVVTRRLLDANGQPVGSPFPYINHTAQNEALKNLVLPAGLGLKDVAFAYSFTTQSLQAHWVAVRDGLYGHGVQGHLGRDFPAEIDAMLPLKDLENPRFAGQTNPYILTSEEFLQPLTIVAGSLLGQDPNSVESKKLLESHKYIDFYAAGRFESPQLFERTDAEGNPLPFNDQAWPADLDRKAAKARSETIYFWLTVPRKEVSVRKDGQMPPVVVVGHGYGSSRFEMATFGGHFARFGLATLSIDCVSHGIGANDMEKTLARTILTGFGMAPFVDTVFSDRAFDQNGDGVVDSGGDFWTSYVFHTRDVVRQCALDYMQLLRIFKSFDGQRKWDLDLKGDGQPGLAGDFDGDGAVDVGKDSVVGYFGASLGGIMGNLMGSLEPHVSAIIPVSGGGGLGDVGNRSLQGGVREAVILRMMGPLFLGDLNAEGVLDLSTIIPDVNDDARRLLGHVEGVHVGDTLLVENLANDERGCGYIDAEGKVRAGVASDFNDPVRVTVFAGPQLVTGSTECAMRTGAPVRATVESFGEEVEFQGLTYEVGAPLVTLAEGFGERRATPGIRRFLGLGQMVLDGGDPATYARNMQLEPIVYPGTGEKTGAHAIIVTTMGDMNVPAGSGVTLARASGLASFLEDAPGQGKPANQVLLDTYAAEAVHTLGRYHDVDGNPVHIDIENFSANTDLWADRIPRLDPPSRIGFDHKDVLGGYSAAIFPYPQPQGQHGFAFPGGQIDQFLARCRDQGIAPEDCPIGFDVGNFMMGMFGRWFAAGGLEPFNTDLCQSRDDCAGQAPVPERRQ